VLAAAGGLAVACAEGEAVGLVSLVAALAVGDAAVVGLAVGAGVATMVTRICAGAVTVVRTRGRVQALRLSMAKLINPNQLFQLWALGFKTAVFIDFTSSFLCNF